MVLVLLSLLEAKTLLGELKREKINASVRGTNTNMYLFFFFPPDI